MTKFTIQLWILICSMTKTVIFSNNNTQCSLPSICEYFFDISNPVSCYCGDDSPTSDELKLCFYSSQLKQNCSNSCDLTRIESAYLNRCCDRDCEPDPWQSWSSCQGPCGNRTGTRNRSRIVSPEKTNQCGGKGCPSLNETESCLTNCCVVNCQWTVWSVWSECSNSCGDGESKRNRTFLKKAECGGEICVGETEELVNCSFFKNKDCIMDSWSEWSNCILANGKCGTGLVYRNRSIIKHEECNGIPCSNIYESILCQGECCMQNCTISQWSEWSFSNVTCGIGNQTRTRFILDKAECGGSSCPMDLIDIRQYEKSDYRNCSVSAWTNWSPCSNSCGSGYQVSSRYVVIDEACGGSCSMPLTRNQTCSSFADNLDCLVSPWSEWSECIKNCNNGIKYRTRNIIQLPKCKGISCPNLQDNTTCMESCSQLCSDGICRCFDGYLLNDDNVTCRPIFCHYFPNITYEVPGLMRTIHYDYVKFSCQNELIAYGDVCIVSCANPSWKLRGDVANYTCQKDGQFNYQKMYCGQPNYPPTDILIDNRKVEEETSNNECFANLGTKDLNGLLDTFVYSLVNNFENRLQIMGTQLCLNYRPNYEASNNTWLVTIKTTDSGNLSFQKSINISVTDINEPPTSCSFDRVNKIPENVGYGYFVGYLTLLDEDKNFRQFKETIFDSDSNTFEVFYNSTQLVFKYGIRVSKNETADCLRKGGAFCSLNYETSNIHKITVKTVDLGTPSYTVYFDLYIQLVDMNDAPTLIVLDNISIPESLNIGDKIGSFHTFDEDNRTQIFIYEILQGNSDYFIIDQNNLLLRQKVDYEDSSQQSLRITVKSTDNGIPPMNISTEFILKTQNVNEPPFVSFVSNSIKQEDIYFISIEENNKIGDKLATVYVTDPDINDTVSFFIKSPNNTIFFNNTQCKNNTLKVSSTNCILDLYTKVVFHHETTNNLSFTLISVDKHFLNSATNFFLKIKKIPEIPKNIRFFETDSQIIEIDENIYGASISLLTADNVDLLSDLKFTIIQDEGGYFEIINDRILKLKENKCLDYESDSRKNIITVKIADATANLTIMARNVNEFPSDIILDNTKIFENSTTGTLFSTLDAFDPDLNETFTFQIISSSNSAFKIYGNEIKIITTNEIYLNFEKKPFETLEILVTDRGLLNFTAIFNITILDCNDMPKNLFLPNSYVTENVPIGTIIGTLQSSDEDSNQTVRYQLLSDFITFTLSTNGTIMTSSNINYETSKLYNLTVLYYDNGVPPLTSTGTVIIYVNDLNEPPYFEMEESIALNVPENTLKLIGPFQVYDNDLNEILSMKLICVTPLNCNCPITIESFLCENSILYNRTKCNFYFQIYKKLNYEDINSYNVSLFVSARSEQQTNKTIMISVLDVNEQISFVKINDESVRNISIKENEDVIGKISFFDPDFSQTHTIRIIEEYSMDNSPILVVRNQLIRTLEDFKFNFESQNLFNITLEIKDDSSEPLIYLVSFIVIIEDINEQPGHISLSQYKISENALNGSVIAKVAAYDPDNENVTRQNLSFSILYQTLDAFEIIGSDLIVKNSMKLNYEKNENLELIIQVTDNGQPSLSSVEVIEISILDVNDAPLDLQLTDTFLSKNAGKGTIVKELYYIDEDKNQSHKLTISNVDPKNDFQIFEINSFNQLEKISNDEILDSEVHVTVYVADDGVPSLNGSLELTIHIVDETLDSLNEIRFILQNVNEISENAFINDSIGYLQITLARQLTFTQFRVVSSDAKQYFNFFNLTCSYEGPTTKCILEMVLISKLDYEEKSVLDISVTLGGDNNVTVIAQQDLQVLNVNERPTDIISSPEKLIVKEIALPNEVVGVFRMIDDDFDEKGHFQMIVMSDKLILLENGTLLSTGKGFDYEKDDPSEIVIRAIDHGNLVIEKSFSLAILDQNEEIKSIIPNLVNVFENATDNQILCSFILPGLDENQNISLIIVKNFKENFFIRKNDLVLKINESMCWEYSISCPLNFESKTNNISLEILAKDLDVPKNSKLFIIHVAILDANDPPTNIQLSNWKVEENILVGSLVGQISVVDEDLDDSFKCSVKSDSPFYVDANLNLFTKAPLDYETQASFEVIIECLDHENSSVINKHEISVTDINEAPDKIYVNTTNEEMILTANENSKSGTRIGVIYCNDPDRNDYLEFYTNSTDVSCQNSQCLNLNLNYTKCLTEIRIQFELGFNFERQSELYFQISVTDRNNNSLSEIVKIIILNVDENPTDLKLNDSTSNKVLIEENSSNYSLGELSAIDEDINELYSFQILILHTDSVEIKHKNELWIKESAELNYESSYVNYFVVGAYKDQILIFNKTYFIQLIDVNEAPQGLTLYPSTVTENIPSGSVIGKFSILDSNLNSTIEKCSLQLITFNEIFLISQFQLELKVNTRLDYEKTPAYNLGIRVTDYGPENIVTDFEIILEISDANERPENLSLSNNQIPENEPIGSLIAIINAQDNDKNSTLVYTLDVNEKDFYIENNKLLSGTVFDHENRPRYQITITVFDNGDPKLNVSKTFDIEILNSNENPEIIIKDQYGNKTEVFHIMENNELGAPEMMFATITVFEPDFDDKINCQIISDNSRFLVQKKSEIKNIFQYDLTINQTLDYEQNNYFEINIEINDMKNFTAIMKIFIFVENVNEPPTNLRLQFVGLSNILQLTNLKNILFGCPWNEVYSLNVFVKNLELINFAFSFNTLIDIIKFVLAIPRLKEAIKLAIDGSREIIINITENIQGYQSIANFITTDPDQNDVIKYSILNCLNCNEKFEFSNGGSKLYLKESQFFDYESNIGKDIKVLIRAIDSGGLSIDLEVPISIQDANDPPTVAGLNFTMIPSFVEKDFIIGKVNVFDEDNLSTYNQIECSIIKPLKWFSILNKSQNLEIVTTATRFIDEKFIDIEIQCFNNGHTKIKSTTYSTALAIEDINNEPATFSFNWTVDFVTENSNNISLGQLLLMTDYSNKSLQISKSSIIVLVSNNIKIQINEDNSFMLTDTLDYETENNFLISFTLIDKNSNQSINLKVQILDVNEAPSEIKSFEKNLTMFEKSPPNIHIATFYATDPDYNQIHSFDIQKIIVNGEIFNHSIVKIVNNELLTDVNSLDVVVSNYITYFWVEILCRDDGQPSLSIQSRFYIQIINVNDGPTAINYLTKLTAIKESANINTVLAIFEIEDEDTDDIHQCHGSNSYFGISNSSIYIAKRLDYETFTKMETIVVCFDQSGLNVSSVFQIDIEDVNEPPENVKISNDQWNEKSEIGLLIANLSANDPEGSQVQFVLNSCKNVECPFYILQNSSIFLNKSLQVLTENDQLEFEVTVSDILNTNVSLSLEVTIFRENLAQISMEFKDVMNLPENSPIGSKVLEIQINFLSNFMPNINCEIFSDGNFFIIVDFKVLLNKFLDYETNSHIMVTVKCFQNKLQILNKLSTTINVTDVDEPLKEIIVNITDSIQEGLYTNKYIGNIIIKDPEFNISAIKCVAFNISLYFANDKNCVTLPLMDKCDLSFNLSISGNFNYEILLHEIRFSIECGDAISSISKDLSIKLEDKNDPAIDLVWNGSTIIDLDLTTDGSFLGNLLVIDEDLNQMHDIMIQYPANKYFYIINCCDLMTQNLEYAWTGPLNASFIITDNGIPPMKSIFNISFNFIESKGEISATNRLINITDKANTLIGILKYSLSNSDDISFILEEVLDNAFSIMKDELWLTKDADQLSFTNITLKIRSFDQETNLPISNGNLRLEVVGISICHFNSNKCHRNATCKSNEMNDEFQCFCNPGFVGNGSSCEEIDECLFNFCLGDSSRCIDLVNDFQCLCGSDRSGRTCEVQKVNLCLKSDCVHGICRDDNSCLCLSGWEGIDCNKSIDDCIGDPCNGRGVCEDALNGFICNCQQNFTGIFCEFDHFSCKNCFENFGVCLNLKNKNQYCLDNSNISNKNFNFSENLINQFSTYKIDFFKFISNIIEFENFTIYFNILNFDSINYRMDFSLIDNNGNVYPPEQSWDIVKQNCNFTDSLSSPAIICSELFPPVDNPKKRAENLKSQFLTYCLIFAIYWGCDGLIF